MKLKGSFLLRNGTIVNEYDLPQYVMVTNGLQDGKGVHIDDWPNIIEHLYQLKPSIESGNTTVIISRLEND